MTDRNEIRKAHEIVDKIYSLYERETLRKLLPPRPEVTFGETIEKLKALASGDDIHLWEIIRQLEQFEKSYWKALLKESGDLPFEDVPEGSLAAKEGEGEVWRKGMYFWKSKGADLALDDKKMAGLDFKILRWGWGDD